MITVLGLNIPFFLWCHGVYGILAEKVIVPGTGANGEDCRSETGGIESSGRGSSFCCSVGG